jgi:hypothetical protein
MELKLWGKISIQIIPAAVLGGEDIEEGIGGEYIEEGTREDIGEVIGKVIGKVIEDIGEVIEDIEDIQEEDTITAE